MNNLKLTEKPETLRQQKLLGYLLDRRTYDRRLTMTREELSKLRSIQKEIELIKKELNTITEEYVTDKVTGSMVEHPYVLTYFKISGYDSGGYSSKVKRLERKLKRKLDELMDERARIEEYIESIDDATIRMILRLRHINGLKWEQVGREIGYTERQCRRKYKEFFEKRK